MAKPESTARKVTKADEPQVAKAPGVEGDLDREPVSPEEANELMERASHVVYKPTEADNPSPGRNAVPVTADEGGPGKIPGTDVPETRAPKAGDSTR